MWFASPLSQNRPVYCRWLHLFDT